MSEEPMKLSVPEPISTKKPWQSKTNWLSLIVALAAFIPPVQVWISENPEMFAQVMAGIFFALRMITKDKIAIK